MSEKISRQLTVSLLDEVVLQQQV